MTMVRVIFGLIREWCREPLLLHTTIPSSQRISILKVSHHVRSPKLPFALIKLKVISYSPTSRNHVILGLGLALDQYILRGVQHNVPFVHDVLRNEDFVKGYTSTGFIGEHYLKGFTGGQLSEKERRELVVIAREIQRRRELVMNNPSLALSGRSGDHDGEAIEEEVVVCLGGMFGDAHLVRSRVDSSNGSCATSSVTRISTIVEDDVEVVNLSALDYEPSNDLAQVKIVGESRALQVSHCLDHAILYDFLTQSVCLSDDILNFILVLFVTIFLSRFMEMLK